MRASSFSRLTAFSVLGLVAGLLVWAFRSMSRLPHNVADALNDAFDNR